MENPSQRNRAGRASGCTARLTVHREGTRDRGRPGTVYTWPFFFLTRCSSSPPTPTPPPLDCSHHLQAQATEAELESHTEEPSQHGPLRGPSTTTTCPQDAEPSGQPG